MTQRALVWAFVAGLALVAASMGPAKASPATSGADSVPQISAPEVMAEQASTPALATVHQVWTSTSSGRLDELSPDIIGKLRPDFPFLAAYATRPRLVGSAAAPSSASSSPGALDSPAASAPEPDILRARQDSSLPAHLSLADFKELNVESASSSRSEHTHRRKTTLKRQPKGGSGSGAARGRRILAAARRIEAGRVERARAAASRGRSSGAGKLRRRLNNNNLRHHMNIIKHGRFQEQPASGKGGLDNQAAKPGRPTATTQTGNGHDDHDDDVELNQATKGGSTGAGRPGTPFYAAKQPKPGNSLDSEPDRDMTDEPELKRVGDEDVDSAGDTVFVEPKSDGVDDDPELPAPEGSVDEGSEGREVPSSGAEDSDDSKPDSQSSSGEAGDSALGGGISGALAPGSKSAGSNNGARNRPGSRAGESGVEFADKDSDADADVDADADNASSPARPKTDLGRGRAHGDDEQHDQTRDQGSQGRKVGRADNHNPNSGEESDDAGNDGHATTGEGPSDESTADEDEPKDRRQDKRLDETDEPSSQRNDARGERKQPKDDSDIAKDGRDETDVGADDSDRSAGSNKGRGSQRDKTHGSDFNKDHGSGDHQDHGHHDEHGDHCDQGHHSHHDSIKWLQDAVPGEPGRDYPILSRANGTSFNCREQKYPGYYADVEARCQVSCSVILQEISAGIEMRPVTNKASPLEH